MIKKVFAAVIILITLGGLIAGYFTWRDKKEITPVKSAMDAVPRNVAFFMESRDPVAFFKNLNKNNLFWNGLQPFEIFSNTNGFLERLAKFFRSDPTLINNLGARSFIVSAHMSGLKKFNMLFILNVANFKTKTEIEQIILDFTETENFFGNKIYDGVEINQGCGLNDSAVYFAIHKDHLIASKSQELVEESIRQLNSDASLKSEISFKKVFETAGLQAGGNLYINYRTLPEIISVFINPLFKSELKTLSSFMEWTGLDFTVKPNSIQFNGFSFSNDSNYHYLNIFKNQKPVEIKITEVLPSNTALFFAYGISDFKLFFRDYRAFLENNNKLFDYNLRLAGIEDRSSLKLENEIQKWIGNEISIFFTEGKMAVPDPNAFAALKIENPAEAESFFNNLNLVYKNDSVKSDSIESIKQFRIRKLNVPDFLQNIFGFPFHVISGHYFLIHENTLFFGNSINSMRMLIHSIEKGKFISEQQNYRKFSENLSSESNLFIYSNIGRSSNIFKEVIGKEFSDSYDSSFTALSKFEAAAVQFSSNNEMLFTNAIINYNPVYRPSANTLWEIRLDAPAASRPFMVTNHKTGEKEILIQDSLLNLYQISNSGNINWKIKLDDFIQDEIIQVDLFKNQKLQYVFCSQNKLYSIDRNGKSVTGFPVKFKGNLSSGFITADYDGKNDYRFLIPLNTGEILNYSGKGEAVKGWDFKVSQKAIQTLCVKKIGTGNFILFLNESGDYALLDKWGKEIFKINLKDIRTDNGSVFIKGKSLETSSIIYSCKNGDLTRKYFNGEEVRKELKLTNNCHIKEFETGDDSIPEIIIREKDQIMGYNTALNNIMEINLENDIETIGPELFLVNGKGYLGYFDKLNQEIFIYNASGKILPGFPIFGGQEFTLCNLLKDGPLNLLTTDKQGTLLVYVLE